MRSVVILAVIPALLAAAATAGDDAAPVLTVSAEERRLLDIRTEPVVAATAITRDGVPGIVVLPLGHSAMIAAPFAGRITRVLVEEGAQVAAGQALAVVASREFAEAQARLAKARAEHALKQAQAARDASLLAEGVIPAVRAERSAAALQAHSSELAAARSALGGVAVAEGDAAYTLTAAMTGTVVERKVSVGESLAAMDGAFLLVDLDALRLELRVAQADALKLASGGVVKVGALEARISGRGAVIDPATQTVKVWAELPPGSGLLVGQRVSGSILLPAPAGAIDVPRTALTRAAEITRVYVSRDDRIVPLSVVVHGESALAATITGALAPGDAVVVSGIAALKAMAGP